MSVKNNKNIEEKLEVGGGETGKSFVPDPVGGKATLPRSNQNGEAMKKAQNPAGTPVETTNDENNVEADGDYAAKNKASVAMKEEIKQLFDGQDVTEDFIDKATTIFEGAIAVRVAQIEEDVKAAYEATLDEEIDAIRTELAEKVENYVEAVSTQWLEENAVAIESSLKSEITEDFIDGMKTLFAEHYMDIPTNKVNVVENLSLQVKDLETKLNETMKVSIEKDKKIESFHKAEILKTASEGLVLTQADKLKTMAEGIDAPDLETFKKKVETLKESVVTGKIQKTESNILSEEFESDEDKSKVNVAPDMKRYMDAISRSVKN